MCYLFGFFFNVFQINNQVANGGQVFSDTGLCQG